MAFELLTGEAPPARVRGWATVAQQRDHDDVWRAFGPALTQFAREHGFEPFKATRRKPAGPKFEAWRSEFLAAHTY